MKFKLVMPWALVVGFTLVGVPSFAHHGTGVAYETEKKVTLKGTVTELIWANPHCGILFDVADDKGQVVHWGAELGNPHALSEAGMSKDVLKPGDKITVSYRPLRDGKKGGMFVSTKAPDGRLLSMQGGQNPEP